MMAPEELGRLIDEHSAALVLYARQWCAAPEDVVQEAFIKLARQVAPPHVVPWLFKVVRNGAISARRSELRRVKHETTAAAQNRAWFVPAEGVGLDAAEAAAALRELPLDEREAIVAHLWGGLTFDEIGRLMSTSGATAHRRFTAGLESLRKRMSEPCPNPPTIQG
jgi:RNA polymerase sigma-70 factor (ECF subfamily)